MATSHPCNEYDPQAQSVQAALVRILDQVEPMRKQESVALRQAFDRVLAQDLISPIDVPGWPNSAMDGYALRSIDGEQPRQIVGASLAGHPFYGCIESGQCVRIMTGAVIPTGADSVVPQELTRCDGDSVNLQKPANPGEHIRLAGEDLRAGQVALAAGVPLRPAMIGVIASLGIDSVPVYRQPRVAFFSTGDELQQPGRPLSPGQIYDSNRHTLCAMLKRLGIDGIDLGQQPDHPDTLRATLQSAQDLADIIISSGGVSVGEADYIKPLLEQLGQVHFWKINMKPGRPLAFGRIGQALFFGLPGNPVSVMATFYQFVRPALLKYMGLHSGWQVPRLRVHCQDTLKKRPGRVEFQRGILSADSDGAWSVRSAGAQGSHVLSAMSRANCFIVLDEHSSGVNAGDWVAVELWEGLT